MTKLDRPIALRLSLREALVLQLSIDLQLLANARTREFAAATDLPALKEQRAELRALEKRITRARRRAS
ncbi:hypothetical protein [Rhodoplanes sp. SY1]|uniref:hypothetical protein n=1 Tax=Rhodoplanes sp. SY1 TaxID=3166646 RepID=UPI0038B4A686